MATSIEVNSSESYEVKLDHYSHELTKIEATHLLERLAEILDYRIEKGRD
jgi:hypothetical protein